MTELDVEQINCWHAIHSSTILAALREVEAGMPADGVYLSLYSDADLCEDLEDDIDD